jgi:riboflavin kinase / FMN adenylyltransferase
MLEAPDLPALMSPHQTRSATSRPFVIARDEPAPPELRRATVAIGNFDGIHVGHRKLIARAIALAGEAGGPSAVLTFEPHPRKYFAPDRPMFRLTPEPVKLAILRKLGLDGVFIRRFDKSLAGTTAADFVTNLLAGELGAAGVIVGHDFHFGRGREGTPPMLADLCARAGLSCEIVPAVALEGHSVSSSDVRAALESGDVGLANRLLGYRWFVEGEVRHGDKRGRELNFPTVNLAMGEDFGLKHGIYAVRVALPSGEVRDGVASFGRRPTFDNGALLLEVHIFDFSGDLYGHTIQVEFVGWIRGEERFGSAEALVARMQEDAAEARRILARANSDPLDSFIGSTENRSARGSQ